MTKQKKFWDRIAEKYARTPIKDQAAYEHKIPKTQEYLTPESRVFEFGCGTGVTAVMHAPHAAHVDAIDISSAMIDIARRRACDAGAENVTFSVGTIEAFSGEDGAYDVILALSILHLLEDPEAAIAKSFSMLKPGGVLISSTACLEDSMPLMKYLMPAMRLIGKAPYVNFLTEQSLTLMMTGAGFAIDYRYHPKKRDAVFLVARKPG